MLVGRSLTVFALYVNNGYIILQWVIESL